MSRDYKLVPRNGTQLIVLIVARISGCQSQKEASLDDQVAHCKHSLDRIYEGPVEYKVVSTKGKGEALDRPELSKIRTACQEGDVDVLIMEDVGRLVRGVDAANIWGMAVDQGIRCIAPLDGLDTNDQDWEARLIKACASHVEHNELTSRRIKQKGMIRFEREGAMTALPIAGYLVPETAKTYFEWKKVDTWTSTIQEGLEKLRRLGNCSAIADYFNESGFPVGPYCQNSIWDGAMVRRFYKNRILGGKPGRGFRESVKQHSSGRRLSRKKAGEPVYIDCPHLAHVDIDELDQLNQQLAESNANLGRKDARGRVNRKDSIYPAQSATCFYCGHHYVRGANGVRDSLMCSASREWKCWNSVGFKCPLAVTKILDAVLQQMTNVAGTENQFKDLVRQVNESSPDVEHLREQLRSMLSDIHTRETNLNEAIRNLGYRDFMKEELNEIDRTKARAASIERKITDVQNNRCVLPESLDLLIDPLKEQLAELAVTSVEFRECLVALVPEFDVFLVRLIDGGHPMPRAQIRINLASSVSPSLVTSEMTNLLSRSFCIDLFEPPQREQIRQQVVAEISKGRTQRDVAAKLGVSQPAVQIALKLHRQMTEENLTSPYYVLHGPPEDYNRLRRHRNARYLFTPQEGYTPPDLI